MTTGSVDEPKTAVHGTTIHLSLQGKGGVGKSLVASSFCAVVPPAAQLPPGVTQSWNEVEEVFFVFQT
jgi:hypothetical protein